jgi:hypothetical protein
MLREAILLQTRMDEAREWARRRGERPVLLGLVCLVVVGRVTAAEAEAAGAALFVDRDRQSLSELQAELPAPPIALVPPRAADEAVRRRHVSASRHATQPPMYGASSHAEQHQLQFDLDL